jgi:peptidyl-prolyl cis-trans isomerase A (cyclophilin A)/peptidyl-prolyl cis-trans isomerase B (cyclophilin B)
LQACSYKNKVDSNYYCQKLGFSCIQSNKIINFKTSKGDFEVELFGKDNPVTVSNFLENIDNAIYVNQKFYKIIIYPQIKFIHGGVNAKNKLYFERNQKKRII